MKILIALEKISQLHCFIKEGKTGTPESLAQRLAISRASLYRIIDELKSYDAPIEYSRERETFFYTKCFELEMQCTISLIDDEVELKKIIGGCKIFSSVSILRRKDDNFTIVSREC